MPTSLLYLVGLIGRGQLVTDSTATVADLYMYSSLAYQARCASLTRPTLPRAETSIAGSWYRTNRLGLWAS